MEQIKFGTDGWRGILGGDFTPSNVARVAEAITRYLFQQRQVDYRQGVVVGYDNRPSSKGFAELVARIISTKSLPVYLSNKPIPTPAVAYAIREKSLAGGIMITASHNPPQYNGIKFIPHYAGPATEKITLAIEELLAEGRDDFAVQKSLESDLVQIIDCGDLYLDCVRRLPFYKNHNKSLRIVVDSMYGSGNGYLEQLLRELNHDVVTIHSGKPSVCQGLLPEPIERNLHDLSHAVLTNEADIGIALDGDADRFGLMDSNGQYISPNRVYGSIAHYLGEGNPGKISFARTVATTHMIDRIGEKLGIGTIETAVGFKNLGQAMLNNNVSFAAEESGGMGVNPGVPEKDGIVAGLLIVHILSVYKLSLLDLLLKTEEIHGRFISGRVDIKLSHGERVLLLNRLKDETPSKLAGKAVCKISRIDGLKVTLQGGAWCLIRPSGTEDLLRIYGEAFTEGELENIINGVSAFYGIPAGKND